MSNLTAKVDPVALAEALSSRLAHEMVGPVGAISNGLELMRELGADAGEDVNALIDASAETAGARLQFYRLAYGRAGFANSSVAQFRSAATAFLSGNENHSLAWPMPPMLPTLIDGAGRVALILIEIAEAALIRGGTISVTAEEDGVKVTAEGTDITFSDDLTSVLSAMDVPDEIQPANVHAVLASLYADAIGWKLSADISTEKAVLRAEPSTS